MNAEPSITDQLMAITDILADPMPTDAERIDSLIASRDDALDTIAALRARVAELEEIVVQREIWLTEDSTKKNELYATLHRIHVETTNRELDYRNRLARINEWTRRYYDPTSID